MNLTTRPAKAADLTSCLTLCRPGVGWGSEEPISVHPVWYALLAEGSVHLRVIETIQQPAPPRLVAFTFMILVSDAFVQHAHSEQAVSLTLPYLLTCPTLDAGTILRPREMHKAYQQGELNMLFLMGSGRKATQGERTYLRSHVVHLLSTEFRGYPLKAFLAYSHGEDERVFLSSTGLKLRPLSTLAPCSPGTSPDSQPELLSFFSITREEIVGAEGSTIAALFLSPSPRLRLKPVWQEVLLLALDEASDNEIAEMLNISLSAVKHRWNALYHHLAELETSPFPASSPVSTRASSHQQKRRFLLQYVRQHPEELRPPLSFNS